jgi:hypothetical protein
MERVGTLIQKLQEQLEQQQDASKLLLTAQLLVAELQQKQTVDASRTVAVTIPIITPQVVADPVLEQEEPVTPVAPVQLVEPKPQAAKTSAKREEQSGWLFDPDPIVTIPTLAHQEVKEVYELNDVVALAEDATKSNNERLKEEKVELATALLQGNPIKDLKKAIGINDRYLFINELFRGDEDMYERSIKTINSFNIYPEAEYWIQREMKTKLGWLETNETVKMFDQLVKRRFS